MLSRPRYRPGAASAMAVVITAGVLAGCGTDAGTPPPADPAVGVDVDEVSAHHGRRCPKRLPQREDPDEAFGTQRPAHSAPMLPTPESAWVCRYDLSDGRPEPDGDGAVGYWVRQGRPRVVQPVQVSALQSYLTALVPADDDPICPADLGPRWLLGYSHGNDLSGVVVDEFGCASVRLTDEPFLTVPGDATQAGIVPGVLSAPEGFARRLGSLYTR